jgi:DNA replication and repair protein RecF
MDVRTLKLRGFRNYDSLDVSFTPGINVITGPNAQGKTNLLESLVYLSLTRSHRVANDRKLIKEGAPFARLACVYHEGGRDYDLEAVIHPDGKTLMVHQQPVRRASAFIGRLNVILFAPDDLHFFLDSPKERRRLLNQEITKLSGSYLLALNRYQNMLKDRNLLLKEMRPDPIYLAALNEKMAEEEVHIITDRKAMIDGINASLNDLYRYLANDDQTEVSIQYDCCLKDEEISRANLLAMHEASQVRDLETRITNAGIHREDMTFWMNDKKASDVASQGQKRMIMLSFKMALHAYIRKISGRNAVLLLDDVMSELDEEKQQRLMNMISDDVQSIITTTGLPSFLRQRNIHELTIQSGRIINEGGNHGGREKE